MNEPQSLIHDGLWALLEASSEFTALVPAGNRIKYNGTLDEPEKPAVADADTPNVRILPVEHQAAAAADSSGEMQIDVWAIQVGTGRLQSDRLHALEWAITRALRGWRSVFSTVTYDGSAFVVDLHPIHSAVALKRDAPEQDVAQGPPGWLDVWRIEVRSWFLDSTLQPPTS
ncbi:MAG: hypothetical protein ACOY3P_20335 [Planctomycetota bacterium]